MSNPDAIPPLHRRLALIFSSFALGVAICVLITWLIGQPGLLAFWPVYVAMPRLVAIIFLLLSLGVLFSFHEKWGKFSGILGLFGMLLTVGGMTADIANHGWSLRFWFEHIKYNQQVFSSLYVPPLMGWTLTVFGASLAILFRFPRKKYFAEVALVLTGLFTLLGLTLSLWYLFGVPILTEIIGVPISFLGAVEISSFGIALIVLYAGRLNRLSSVLSDSLGARLFRSFVPVFIVTVLIENLLHIHLAEENNHINVSVWSFISVLVSSLILGLFSWLASKRLENQFEQMQNVLRASESKVRSVLEQSLDGMALIDSRGSVISWNNRMETITGLRSDQALKRPIYDLVQQVQLTGFGRVSLEDAIAMFLTGKGLPDSPIDVRIKPMGRKEFRRIEALVFSVDEASGNLLCVVARDITVRKLAEDRLSWELRLESELAKIYKPLIEPDISLNQVTGMVLETAKRLTGSLDGYISAIDQRTGNNLLYGIFGRGILGDVTPKSKHGAIFQPLSDGAYPANLFCHALNVRCGFYTNDPKSHPSYQNMPASSVEIKKFLSVPVLLADKLVGQIVLANPRNREGSRDYADHDLHGIQHLAEYYALAIQRIRAEDAIHFRISQLSLLNEIAKRLTLAFDDHDILHITASMSRQVFMDSEISIFVYLPESQTLAVRATSGLYRPYVDAGYQLPADKGLVGYVATSRQHLLVNHVRQDARYFSPPGQPSDPIGSELCVPIKQGDRLFGVLDVQNVRENAYDRDDLGVMETLAGILGVALESASLYDKLRVSEKRYRRLFNEMREGFALHEIIRDENGAFQDLRYLEVNPAFERLVGLNAEKVRGHTLSEIFPSLEPVFWENYRIAAGGSSVSFESKVATLARFYSISAFQPDHEHLATIFSDVTAHRNHENSLQAALKEKEVLLKEVHHRVKNNLQVIISLLSLRSENIQDPQAIKVFADCQNSVRAIALIHERIYQSASLAFIDAGEYLNSLVNHLVNMYSRQAGSISVSTEIDPVQIDLDDAIPCGLIVTELLTNAIKHAFPANAQLSEPPAISVKVKKNGDELLINISDNGIGVPEGFRFEKADSLGLQLVGILAQKLRAELLFANHAGAQFSIKIPYHPPQ